jgi:hypothetical protein
VREGECGSEIKVVREDDVLVCPCPGHDRFVCCSNVSHRGPVGR